MGLIDRIKGLGSKIITPVIKPRPINIMRNIISPSFTNTGQRITDTPRIIKQPSFTNTGQRL